VTLPIGTSGIPHDVTRMLGWRCAASSASGKRSTPSSDHWHGPLWTSARRLTGSDMVAAAAISGRPVAWGGVALGVVMVGVAAVQLRRAARRFLELVAQRDALSRQLGEDAVR
jgi:hypothetical protein